jgi:hypothetical protein
MQPEQIVPLLTGSGGAMLVMFLWIKALTADKRILEAACNTKDATISMLHGEIKSIAMEYATNISKTVSSIQNLPSCQYKQQGS